MLIDCHTHLDEFEVSEVTKILRRASGVGIDLVVSAGTTFDSSVRCSSLSRMFPSLYAGIGVHPMDLVGPIDEQVYGSLQGLACSNDKIVVISEIGLDFANNAPDRALQYQAFREQIRLARDLQKPIVFHSRDAYEDTLRVLREERAYQVGGVMHYFQSDLNTALSFIDLGFYISLARPLLRMTDLQDVVSNLPLDSLVLESDSAPQPFKVKRENWTEPRHVLDVAIKVAEIKNKTLEEVASVSSRNFMELIGMRKDNGS